MLAMSIQKRKPASTEPIYLNHFYMVLDSATFKAIASDEFLQKQFAVPEQRTTVRKDITYMALYFYGANTYIEFMEASQAKQIGLGAPFGIALGVDEAGGLQALEKQIPTEIDLNPEPRTRLFDDKQLGWFFIARPKNLPYINLWLMEWHPEYLTAIKSKVSPQETTVSRKQFIESYSGVLGKNPQKAYLQDVIGLTISLDKTRAARLVDVVQLLGYRTSTKSNTTLLQGPDFTMTVVAEADSTKARGIQQINMRTRATPTKTVHHFGTSTLRFERNNLATWSF
ncbi:hypothetical protein GCM10023189_31480 [Nibrella saemangeumensis]|uniref:Uncharacterized protein n=2 Tax=Nibrella saemangeumensis TaxID=1084526 RepID=A0ABP8N3T5_9BACT